MSRLGFGLSLLIFCSPFTASAAPAATPAAAKLPTLAPIPAPSALTLLIELVKKPSAKKLTTFKSRCQSSGSPGVANENTSIDFDGNLDANRMLTEIQGHGDLLSVRAAVHATLHCTQGASTERVRAWLGNELLMRHSRSLVRALEAEGAADRLASIVEIENSDWDAVNCEGNARCERHRKELFGRKRKALQYPHATAAEEIVRQKLLAALKSDQ